jgi:hypothetical protein
VFLKFSSLSQKPLDRLGDVYISGDDVAVPALGQSNFLAGLSIISIIAG